MKNGKNMGLSVDEEVKNYLNRLSREYVFHYMFSGEKFGLVNNLNILKKPLLILGPEDASEKYGYNRCGNTSFYEEK